MMLHCKRCEKFLPHTNFGSDKSRISGKSIYCKKCRARLAKEQRQKRPAEKSQYDRYRRYGISKEKFDSMMETQENRCAICKTDKPSTAYGIFYVDHCHKTGAIRGLLCHKCNTGIGLLNDDPSILESAILYLQKYDSTKG
jgi:hypothetical protein